MLRNDCDIIFSAVDFCIKMVFSISDKHLSLIVRTVLLYFTLRIMKPRSFDAIFPNLQFDYSFSVILYAQ
jgi:hypothetical protein